MTLMAGAAIIDNQKILSPAAITIVSGRIAAISTHASQASVARRLDVSDMMLFPGLVNAHCHLDLTVTGTLLESDFVDWIRNLQSSKRYGITEEAVVAAVRQGFTRLLHSGITTVFDHVSHGVLSAAYRNTPLRTVCFGEVLGIDAASSAAALDTLLSKRRDFPVPLFPSPHAVHSVAPEVLRQTCQRRDGPLSIHCAESAAEAEYFSTGSGEMVRLLNELSRARGGEPIEGKIHSGRSALDHLLRQCPDLSRLLLVHGNYLDAGDLERLARLPDVCVVHCPGSFEFFKHERFPLAEIRRHGIPVALGTDSLASNHTLSLLDEIRRFKQRHAQTTWQELLPMVTTNSLAVIGVGDRGEIRAGWAADLMGIRGRSNEDPLALLAKAERADFVMVGGVIRVLGKIPQ